MTPRESAPCKRASARYEWDRLAGEGTAPRRPFPWHRDNVGAYQRRGLCKRQPAGSCAPLCAPSRLTQAAAPHVPLVAPPGGRPLAKSQRRVNKSKSPRYGTPTGRGTLLLGAQRGPRLAWSGPPHVA